MMYIYFIAWGSLTAVLSMYFPSSLNMKLWALLELEAWAIILEPSRKDLRYSDDDMPYRPRRCASKKKRKKKGRGVLSKNKQSYVSFNAVVEICAHFGEAPESSNHGTPLHISISALALLSMMLNITVISIHLCRNNISVHTTNTRLENMYVPRLRALRAASNR